SGWTLASQEPDDYTTGCNLGVLTGALSGNLVCVDLDSPEAIALAREYLPPTCMRDGRTGKPDSHWWYKVTGDIPPEHTAKLSVAGGAGGPASRAFKHAETGKGVLDFLATGRHCVVPPSRHESGQAREWGDPDAEPAEIAFGDLFGAVIRLVATCGG